MPLKKANTRPNRSRKNPQQRWNMWISQENTL